MFFCVRVLNRIYAVFQFWIMNLNVGNYAIKHEETRHRNANRLDPNPLTQSLPLCLHFILQIIMWHKLSYACPIIMNFLEDWGVGIVYQPTMFQLHRLINNGDLLSDRHHWKHTQTDTQTDTQTHTQIETDTLPTY